MSIIFLLTVAGIGVIHTLLEPNHYLPFIILSKVRNWGLNKTLGVTALCGAAHIISSVVLGLIGVGLGVAITHIEIFDGYRANIAAWALMLFGLFYMVFGLRQAFHNKECHCHRHGDKEPSSKSTVASLFLIFLIAPCDVWIPLMMVPAIQGSLTAVTLTALLFSGATIVTMTALVILGRWGVNFLPFKKVERYGHAVAGAVILLCGIAMQVMDHSHAHGEGHNHFAPAAIHGHAHAGEHGDSHSLTHEHAHTPDCKH